MLLRAYKFLFLTALFLLSVDGYAQDSREPFFQKLGLAYDLVYDNPEQAIELIDEAFKIAQKNQDKWAMAIGRAGTAYISYEVGDFKAAYQNYVDALESLERADTVDLYNKTIILNELSMLQSDFNNHDESIEYSYEALKTVKEYINQHRAHAEENDVTRLLVDIPYYIAVEYQEKGAHQTAGEILVELWEEAEDKEDVVTYAQVLNELGIIKMKNAEYGDAQEYFGIVVSSLEVGSEDKSIAYHNLAETYLDQGNYVKANSYFLIALDMKKELEDAHSQFITYQKLGVLEHKYGSSAKAIDYWETGLSIYDDVASNPELYSVYNWLQLAYMDIDVEKAKEFNQKYAQLNDFYVKNQAFQREEEAQNRQELINYIDDQRQQRVDAEQRNRFIQKFWPLFVGVGLLILFSMIMGVRYYRALRTNKALSSIRAAGVSADSE